MKLILPLLLLSTLCRSQTCPPGYTFMPSISTTALTIVADTCLPDSTCNYLWQQFNISQCDQTETGVLIWSNNFYRSTRSVWIDSLGCVRREFYYKKVNNIWFPISACLYWWENRTYTCAARMTDGRIIKYPCCGHIHKTKPL